MLDPFAASLRDDPGARINIVGHTDNTGSPAINDPLSVARAQSVRDYLVDRGVSAARVETADQAGWSADALEAQAFSFLAVRCLCGLPITFPTTTGAPRPLIGGVIARP